MAASPVRDADLPRGPSWSDLRVECTRAEREEKVRVRFTVSANDASTRYEGHTLWVRCEVVWREHGRAHTSVGSAVFGGKAGYRTMPAAMLWALHEGLDRVAEERAVPPLLALLEAGA